MRGDPSPFPPKLLSNASKQPCNETQTRALYFQGWQERETAPAFQLPKPLQRNPDAGKHKSESGSLLKTHGPNCIYSLSAGNFTKIMETEKNLRLTHTVHFSTGGRTIRNLVKLWKISINRGDLGLGVLWCNPSSDACRTRSPCIQTPQVRGRWCKGKNKEVIFLWSTFCVGQTIRWRWCLWGELSESLNAACYLCFTSFVCSF